MNTKKVETMRVVQKILKELEEMILDHIDDDGELSPEELIESAFDIYIEMTSDLEK